MKLNIHSQNMLATSAIDEYVHYEIAAALENLDDYIIDVGVYLKKAGEPKSDDDKSVRVTVNLRRRMIVTVKVVREDLYAAIGEACRQIRRRVKNAIQSQVPLHHATPGDASYASMR